jgi:hypothetical protein
VSGYSGRLNLDANCFIYSVERIEPYRTLLQPVWESAHQGHCAIVTSELALLETPVKPLKMGDALLEEGFRGCYRNRKK